jgi:hypothetical protein
LHNEHLVVSYGVSRLEFDPAPRAGNPALTIKDPK